VTWRRIGTALLWALPLLVVAGLGWYQLPGLGPWPAGKVVAFPYDSLRLAGLCLLPVAWVALFFVLIVRYRRGRGIQWGLVGALLAMPLVEAFGLGGMVLGWHEIGRLRLRDGSVYRLRATLPEYLLTTDVSRGLLFRRERVLGYGDPDFPARLVRPQALSLRTDAPASLVASADGRWLVFMQAIGPKGDWIASCQTHLVYDRRAGKVYGAGELEQVSPFVLVGPRDHPNPSDLRALLSPENRVRPSGLTFIGPSVASIIGDLQNQNPEVRAAAAHLLDRVGRDDPELADSESALQAAASSADPVVRDAVQRALTRVEAGKRQGQ